MSSHASVVHRWTLLAGLALLALPDTGAGEQSSIVTHHANKRLKTPISLRAKDASLSEVLQVLSERSGMNFVSGEGVHREKMTILLNKTPLDEAINILVRASGLSYEIIGNSVLIAEPEKLKEEVGQMGYVVELKYIDAEEAAEALSDISSNIKIDKGGNRLVCYTSPRVIHEVEGVIKAIDHPHILVMLETRIIELTMDRIAKYGIDWGALSPIATSVTHEGGRVLDGVLPDKWMRSTAEFTAILDLALSNGDARMLMDSKLTTTNNRTASLHIGDVIPYTVQSYNLSSSGGANLKIEKERVGVMVTMQPHVNEENQVTLTVSPEVSSIVGFKGPSSDIPQIRVRKTNTTVRVEDGQTIFIAGLIREDKTQEIKKLPLLGQIPILGRLFQHRKTDVRKTNLVMEITPRIIKDTRDFAVGSAAGRRILETDPAEIMETPASSPPRPAPRPETPPAEEEEVPEEE